MKNSQKGFIVPVLMAIIALLVVGGSVYIYNTKKVEVPVVVDSGIQQTNNNTNTQTSSINKQTNTPPPQSETTSTGHIVAFEQAVNKSDFSGASKYFADKVQVVLEGSSCCGEIPLSQAKIYFENTIKGLVFTFNSNDTVVKQYIASQAIDYPNRRLITNSPKLYFDELSIGVESNVSQQNKASIGYKVFNDKITVLFINKGRDR